jgi:DNA-binding transcriptional ArsR family regulator
MRNRLSLNIIEKFQRDAIIQPMNRFPQKHVIRNEKQLTALTSAARQELLDVLAEMGTVSVAEIAATLGRPADALYFHLRVLKQVGLVRQAGYRFRGSRKEVLYRTVASELWLDYEQRSEKNRRTITAIISSTLRLGIRDFRRAYQRSDVTVAGEGRELWVLRKTARLSPAEIGKVNRSITRLKTAVSKPQGRGRLYGITVLLTPLDHRGRHSKPKVKPQKARRK